MPDLQRTIQQLNGREYWEFVLDQDVKNHCSDCKSLEHSIYRLGWDTLPGQIHHGCMCHIEKVESKAKVFEIERRLKHYVGKTELNANRKADESVYGKKIDNWSHTTDRKSAAALIAENPSTAGMNFTMQYEGVELRVYGDTLGIPTIGVGANLTNDYVLDKLQSMGVIKASDKYYFKKYKQLVGAELEYFESLKQQIRISEQQARELFEYTYNVKKSEAIRGIKKGNWVPEKDDQGNLRFRWSDTETFDGWNDLPQEVQIIAIDLWYNGGSKYNNFFKAIKMNDYRRAAIELVDSKDAKTGPKGTQKRRYNAAKELSELAEQLDFNPILTW